MNNVRDRLAAALARIGKDPELNAELQDKRRIARDEAAERLASLAAEVTPEAVAELRGPLSLAKAMIRETRTADDRQALMMETIVLRQGRPVLAVMNDEPKLEFREAESEVWRERLVRARSGLAAAARAVGRIEVTGHPTFSWLGTGWLLGADTIVTNRHVAREFGRETGEKFVFRMGVGRRPMTASIDFLEEVARTESLDFSFEEILHIESDQGPDIAFLRVQPRTSTLATPLTLFSGAVSERQQVAVIGYPARDSRIPEQQLMDDIFGNVYDKKRLAPGEIISADRSTLEHDCSTLGGNSGSVVVDLASGEAVALHFAGRFLKANYAVSGEVIAELFAKIGRNTKRAHSDRREAVAAPPLQRPAAGQGGSHRLSVTVPITITVDVGSPIEQRRAAAPAAKTPAPPASTDDDEVFTEGRAEDYFDRLGYDPQFIGVDVPLPVVVAGSQDVLTFEEQGDTQQELKYQHFSVVMSRSRRMCLFSAVNIDGKLSRRTRRARWLMDPRIPAEAQIIKECYGDAPKFSRGHMTRREDPAWGNEAEAELGNRDSMHVTNAVPQLQVFNGGVWLALEDYALQNARHDQMQISLFTGPYLAKDDPEEYGVRIPVRFWKVIAFIHDETGQLCATGYTMSQQEALNGREHVFGQHETTQTAISAIEEETGLSFGELRKVDPLAWAEESRTRTLSDTNQIRFF